MMLLLVPSSENIMVLVLDGQFCGTKQKGKKKFENHIIRQRDGKGPLLKCKLQIQLTDGVGYLQDISFTDNSSWRPSKEFRLAVCCETEGLQEGISNSFRVKDRRSSLNEKHHPPKLTDQVWNLVKIRKDGVYHQRLTDAGILNVQQFLQQLYIDPENLRRLLQNGSSPPNRRIPDKAWEAIITNAKECQEFNDLATASISLRVPRPQCSEFWSDNTTNPHCIAGQNFVELGSSGFSDYVPSEVNRNMLDTYDFQDVSQLADWMDIQPEISNPLVDQLLLIPTSDDATVAKSSTSAIWCQLMENDQVEFGQSYQACFKHSHEAPGFSDIGSGHR